jgi:hypothetical protein
LTAGLGGRAGGGGGAIERGTSGGGGAIERGTSGWFCAIATQPGGGGFAPGMGLPPQAASSSSGRSQASRRQRRVCDKGRAIAASFLPAGLAFPSFIKDAPERPALKGRRRSQCCQWGRSSACRCGKEEPMLARMSGLGIVMLCLGAVPGLAGQAPDPSQSDRPEAILAGQVRQQGHLCDKALEAHRDEALSRADEPVWILVCSNATYQVRLRPDMAARVERIGGAP